MDSKPIRKSSHKSLMILIAVALLGSACALIVMFNVEEVGKLLLGRALRNPDKWKQYSLAVAIFWPLLCFICFGAQRFFRFDKIIIKIWSDLVGRIFLSATAALLLFGLIYDFLVVIVHLDFPYVAGTAVSLYSNFCLYLLVYAAWRKCGISLTKTEIATMFVGIAAAIGLLLYSVITRRYLYFWDYTTYYISALDCFAEYQDSFFWGLSLTWVSSSWDYSRFITLFTMLFFRFTTMTNNAFCGSLAFSVVLPFMIVISGMAIKVMSLFRVSGYKRCIGLSLSLLLTLAQPQLFRSVYYSMPDMLGLVFAVLLLCCLLEYDFSKHDTERWIYLWCSTIALMFTRRWYAFYVVSMWGVYGVTVLISGVRNKSVGRSLNLVKFAVISIIFGILFLAPYVVKAVVKNYSADYASWKIDSVWHNIFTQISHCGAIMVGLSLCGYFYAIVRKKSVSTSIASAVCLVLPLCLFHIVQTADFHQLLILGPSMVLGTTLFTSCIMSINKKFAVTGGVAVAICTSVVNIYNAYSSRHVIFTPLFCNTSLVMPDRVDYYMIDVVNAWIKENCANYGDVYMIPHNTTYCPDIFRKKDLPSESIESILPYGADIVSAHPFPMELFSAQFVITSDPLGQDGDSMAPKINKVFFTLVEDGYFQVNTTFEMGNGYTLIAYERVKSVDEKEVMMYINEFSDNINSYPGNYSALLSLVESF